MAAWEEIDSALVAGMERFADCATTLVRSSTPHSAIGSCPNACPTACFRFSDPKADSLLPKCRLARANRDRFSYRKCFASRNSMPHSSEIDAARFHASLSAFLGVSSRLKQPWWIIGGAATALMTGDFSDVHDVDVLLAPQDARRLIAELDLVDGSDGRTGRFRSEVYGTWSAPPLSIDLLGGFQVKVGNNWTSIAPTTRCPCVPPAGTVFLPSIDEQMELTKLLGRPRDFARIDRLMSVKRIG